MEERTIKVDGVDINFVRAGTGDHPVLFLPGLLGFFRNYSLNIESFDTELTLVLWNPPGYGKSRPPDRTFPDDFHQGDATLGHSLMKTLGYSQFSLVGMGDGGTTALLLAATYPESIHKMVVYRARSYIHRDEVIALEGVLNVNTMPDCLKHDLLYTYELNYIKKIVSQWLDAMRRLSNKENGNLCKQALPKIKCPTLILSKSQDNLISRDQSFHLYENITDSRIRFMYACETDTSQEFLFLATQFEMMIEFLLKK